MSEPHKVSAPKNHVYLVMDGRAHFDLDRATVMEVINEVNADRVWNVYLRDYREAGMDAVLVRYTAHGTTLTSPKLINEWEDLD